VIMDLSELRRDYSQKGLRRSDLNPDPLQQFQQWFQQACDGGLLEPNAMVLSTVAPGGIPYQRTVLLKSFDTQGFVFFTNYESRKAQHIRQNSQVSLLFPWLALERQVHIIGTAQPIPTAESLGYFLSRPRGSQLGAWCSQQSSVISSRQLLESQFMKMQEKFAHGEIPLPSFWGGYRVTPDSMEFWQGRTNRLHDRFLYQRQPSSGSPQSTATLDSSWEIQRLSP